MRGLYIDSVGGSPPVLLVRGEVDIANAPELGSALTEALSTNAAVTVDMSGVTFIDAAGARAIVRAAESMNGSGPLTLVNAARVERLFKLVGLDGIPSIVFSAGGDGHAG